VHVLVVFAHPKRQSFTGRLLESFVQGIEEAGHDVEIADLYSEGFQPLLVPDDYAQWHDRPMPDDVLREQARVDRSDAIALVFPRKFVLLCPAGSSERQEATQSYIPKAREIGLTAFGAAA
jgi:putative NADPH-quinone reductase